MRLPDDVQHRVKKAGITVYYADRRITKLWNKDRLKGEPCQYGGWYWQKVQGRRIMETDTDGPFRSESAAIRDAYVKLQLSSG